MNDGSWSSSSGEPDSICDMIAKGIGCAAVKEGGMRLVLAVMMLMIDQ